VHLAHDAVGALYPSLARARSGGVNCPLPSGSYVIRAYKGNSESDDSNRVCFGPSATQTVKLDPTRFLSWGEFRRRV